MRILRLSLEEEDPSTSSLFRVSHVLSEVEIDQRKDPKLFESIYLELHRLLDLEAKN